MHCQSLPSGVVSFLIAAAMAHSAAAETPAYIFTQSCADFNGHPIPLAGQTHPDDDSFSRYVISLAYALEQAQAITGDQELLSPRNKQISAEVYRLCKQNPDLLFADVLRDVLSAETP